MKGFNILGLIMSSISVGVASMLDAPLSGLLIILSACFVAIHAYRLYRRIP